jgi:hypothetical protein
MTFTAASRDFGYFTYLDDNAQSWNKKGDATWGAAAASGGTAFGTHPMWQTNNHGHHVRSALFQDSTTGRVFKGIVYTPTAFAALTIGTSTVSVKVPGLETAIVYTCIAKSPEKQRGARTVRTLTEATAAS